MSNRFIPDRDAQTGSAPGDVQMPREYEFDGNENEVIGGLAGWMAVVGVIMGIFGLLQVVLGMAALGSMAGILTVGEGVCMMLIGGWVLGASRSFKDIVTTQGSDITLLMHALRKLRSAYTLQGVLLIVACLLIVVVIFLMFGASPSQSTHGF